MYMNGVPKRKFENRESGHETGYTSQINQKGYVHAPRTDNRYSSCMYMDW
jgi:hypothetical protein